MAFGDGVGFDTALGYAWTSPERMHERIVAFASEQLLARGILIRTGTELGLPGWARITVAPDAVMDRAAAALLEARAELTTTEAAAAS
jgi:histidinol-phosphate/aromatic aminotransferase/cobyric acid decarboxylase-like protein